MSATTPDSLTSEDSKAREFSPLEELPVSLFCRISQYLLVVEYDTPNNNKEFICHVHLKRGYALAVCSRRCNELFEESAKFFLDCYGPKNYFIPPVTYQENPSSHLVEFYRVKGLEVTFRNEVKTLEELLTERPMRLMSRQPDFERRLLHQVQRILENPLIRHWARLGLAYCARACARVLHCFDGISFTAMSPNAELAAFTRPLLERMIHLNELLAPDSLALLARCYNLHFLLCVACILGKNPDPEKTNQSMESLIKQIHQYPQALKNSENIRNDYAFANNFLMNVCLSQDRVEEALALLRSSRETTKEYDPYITWRMTELVKDRPEEFGLQRAIEYVTESVDWFEGVESPSTDLKWEYDADKWRYYKQSCSSCLRDLQR